MFRDKRIAVVIPAFCETKLLSRTIGSVPQWVDTIHVVDDGSPDATFAIANGVASAGERVYPVRLGFNQGVGRAIAVGYQRALCMDADVIVVMAGDNQMDPVDLPALLDPVIEGRADYVKGNRLAHPEARRMPPIRRAGTHGLARLTSWAAGIHPIDDSQCGYTALSAQTARSLDLLRLYPRYGYPNDVILRLAEIGARIEEVPVRPVYGEEVSGLRIPSVVGPISGIILRGALRRARRLYLE